jgi:tetratricopeptide (TPR) repeat protein
VPHFLYLSWGDNENIIRDPTQDVVTWLEQNPPPGLTWRHRYYKGDDHGSTPHRTLYDGLEAIFDGFRMTHAIDDVDQEFSLADVEAHYEKLSRKYGYKVHPSSEAIAWCARSLAKKGEKDAAIDLLRRNVGEYPYLADAHASLARALEEAGRLEDALFEFGEALRLGVENEHPYGDPIESYRDRAAKIREELSRRGR